MPKSASRRMVLVMVAMVLVIALVFIAVARQYIAASQLREAESQRAVVRLAAAGLDQRLDGALLALQDLAGTVPAGAAHTPDVAAHWLGSYPGALHAFFSCGVLLNTLDGNVFYQRGSTEIAESPDLDYWSRRVVSLEEAFISMPFVVPQNNLRRIVALAVVPITDSTGDVLAALIGCIDLSSPRFAQTLEVLREDGRGSPFLAAWDGRLIYHSDPSQRMVYGIHPIPPALMQQANHGVRSSLQSWDEQGKEVLTTFIKLQSTGWVLGLNRPVAEAYAVTNLFMRDSVFAGVASILVAGVVTWLMMRLFVLPVQRLAEDVQAIDLQADRTVEPLSYRGGGEEVSLAVQAVNHLIVRVNQNQTLRARLLEESAASQRRLEMILRQAPVGMAITNHLGVIIQSNVALAMLLDVEPVALGAVWLPSLFKDHAAAAGILETARQRGHASSETVLVDGQKELALSRHKDDELVWCQVSAAVFKDRAAALEAPDLIWVFEDVTAARVHSRELQTLVNQLTDSNSELERFAWVASHDLREPLRTITSFSQLLQRSYRDALPAEAQEYMDYVIKAAIRMHSLIGDLLSYSRITGKGSAFVPLELDHVCDVALQNLRESIHDSDAQVDVAPLPQVLGDEIQLMQVFQNLLANALKFRKPGVRPEITVSAERVGGEWQIAITDNGIGIPPSSNDIFEVFRRLHTAQEYPGTGIGLSLCKRIVQRHGGQIWYESEVGQGSRFVFTVPVMNSDLQSAQNGK